MKVLNFDRQMRLFSSVAVNALNVVENFRCFP